MSPYFNQTDLPIFSWPVYSPGWIHVLHFHQHLSSIQRTSTISCAVLSSKIPIVRVRFIALNAPLSICGSSFFSVSCSIFVAMASRLTLLHQSQRGLAAQAAASKRSSAASNLGPVAQSTQLSNGITVAAVDLPTPLVHLGVAVKTGSRFENYENQGVANVMRVAYGLSTHNVGAVTLNRSVGQMGSALQVEQDREYTLFKTVVMRNKAREAMEFLLESVANPKFKPWEINDLVYDLKNQLVPTNPTYKRYFTRLEADMALATKGDRAVDLLHKAAYRQGLGNFISAQKYSLGRHDSALLKAFHSQTVTAPRTSIVSVGLDVETLATMSQSFSLESGSGPSDKAQYFSGELREDDLGGKTVVALAGQICGFTGKELGANMVLAQILSSKPAKRGSGVGKLEKAVGGIAQVRAIQHVYTDSGLLGALIECQPDKAGEAVSSVAAILRSGDVSAEEVNAAKAALFTNSISYLESGANRLRSMGWQTAALGSKNVAGEDAMATMIQTVSVGDVQAAAKKLSSGKLSMGAVGNLSQVPYLDSL